MGRERLGEILVRQGVVSEEALSKALAHQAGDSRRLGELLVDLKLLAPSALLSALARHLNVKCCFVRHGLVDPAAAKLLSREEAVRLKALPLFKVHERLTVVMAEPQSLHTIDQLARLTGCTINPVLGLESNVIEFIDKYAGEQVDIDSLLVDLQEANVQVVENTRLDDGLTHELTRMVEGSPVINLVNLAILTAIRDGASDVHVEPTSRSTRVRYRIDGRLRELMHAPAGMHAAIASRIKVIGHMDIAERRLPQEGRVRVVAEGREIDLRISTVPTLLGEKAVLRILDRTRLQTSLEKLGLRREQADTFERIFSKAHGIVLVTGPTGSGKTTTLYSVLERLATAEKNIVTIEDPVEYQYEGVSQIQTQDSIGLTFARALRSILRQDPDVIMVGEIRDEETARVAIQAALTGHLVLSTLHTNSAPGCFARLADMGIEPYLMASAFNGVIAQRLARTICPSCRTSYFPARSVLADAGWAERSDQVFYRGEGCTQCHDSGFRGRMGIFELLEVTDPVRAILQDFDDEAELIRVARAEGWRPLREEGLHLVECGQSTIEEIVRVTYAEADLRTRAERRPRAAGAGVGAAEPVEAGA